VYTVASAQLPEPPAGADRIFIAPNAVVVLDGASAFAREAPDPAEYVDTLGAHLHQALTEDPSVGLTDALTAAIETAARDLKLRPGQSPSSTVAIARWRAKSVDLLVLGDTQITTPHGVLVDDRLGAIAKAEQNAYRSRLREGHGYDKKHTTLVSALQTAQASLRNRPDGYWIAEARPEAAAHALAATHPQRTTPWLAIATDGFYRPMSHLGLELSPDATTADLQQLVSYCQRWEDSADPAGALNPRAKRHDDKTVVLVRSA
jgi:hypothetical protein